MIEYKKLEDCYEDIKGAALDTLERNKNKYELPIDQAIAYYMNEMDGIFEENELEKLVTLIIIGVFSVKYEYFNCKLMNEIKCAINEIESNKYDNLFNSGDKEGLLEDIIFIKQYI